ncbi:MAG: RpiB/LacA/LacB family sugar-phosphate isomerase [Patescibacteria group bacterium]|nr:RpiB/LacA/LacB family sugar-phosphate isomerase [Patescibacteria group bacterium]
MKAAKPVIYLGSDHAGYRLKEAIGNFLAKSGYKIRDFGAFSEKPSDYPKFVMPAVQAAVRGRGRAIVFGGSGIGECIAANKVKGARAALVYDAYTARITREHNDSNVLCLGGRTVTGEVPLAKRLVKVWLETSFSKAARHGRRLRQISAFEKSGRLPRV